MKIGASISLGVVLLLIVFLGCSGTINGIIRQDAARLPISYSDSRIGKGTLQTVLPDGERFEGQLLEIGSMDLSTAANSGNTGKESVGFAAVQSFVGNAEATLSGNRGRIIKCRFKLSDTVLGLSSGGFGICQVSDGRVIDIFY